MRNIVGVSLSSNHMCFGYSYTFNISKRNEKWLFYAFCLPKNALKHIELKDVRVNEKIISSLISIVEQDEIIKKIDNYKKPDSDVFALDETTYVLHIDFDNKSIYAPICSNALEQFFYELVEEYI